LQLVESLKFPVPVLVDGAHNPAGAETLRNFLAETYYGIPVTLIFGAMADKSAFEMAAALFPTGQHIILTKADNPRAASSQTIAEQTKKLRQDLVCTENLVEALSEAARLTPANGLIVVCGSLYLAGELLHHFTTNVD
jgi:dihydrofolate synthase/folylpolyglutamate synthase